MDSAGSLVLVIRWKPSLSISYNNIKNKSINKYFVVFVLCFFLYYKYYNVLIITIFIVRIYLFKIIIKVAIQSVYIYKHYYIIIQQHRAINGIYNKKSFVKIPFNTT